MTSPCFGIVGWKNAGKTQMVVNLVKELRARGFRVSTVKHGHHSFDIDQPGRDSFRHREAGAGEVLIASARRWAVMHEYEEGETEAGLDALLTRLSPCDLVLVEGFKAAPHPKLEIRRSGAPASKPLAEKAKNVVAIAADFETEDAAPRFDLHDISAIADFLVAYLRLGFDA